MKETEQIAFWKGQFGKEYTDRCTRNNAELNEKFLEQFGKSRLDLDREFLAHLSNDSKILEVGCNTGQKLISLQMQGFEQLYGIELQSYAVEKAKTLAKNINVIQGNAFDLPFKNNYFDLVFTSGVLIHISPNDLISVMNEIYRCSSKYIWGWEYYANDMEEIKYRDNNGFLWKADYCQIYLNNFKDLRLVKKEIVPFIKESEKENKNAMFLLEKTN